MFHLFCPGCIHAGQIFVCCFSTGYYAGVLIKKRDIRKFGSGNAGATNMMLAAGLKQNRTPAQMAACAVWLHGTAADRCARRRSMTAMLPTDIFADLGEILAEMEL